MNESDVEKTVRFYDKQLELGVAEEFALRTNDSRIAGLLGNCLPGDASLLDLGCSVGLLADRLAAHGLPWRRYVGVDLSETAIEAFRKRGVSGTELHVGNATDLSKWEPHSFDAVLCAFLLQDLPESAERKLLRNIPLVLKPGALLVLALTVHPLQPRELGNDYKPGALADRGVPGKFTYLWSMKGLTDLLTQCGFHEQQVHQVQTAAGLVEIYGLWRAALPGAAADATQAVRP